MYIFEKKKEKVLLNIKYYYSLLMQIIDKFEIILTVFVTIVNISKIKLNDKY